MLKEYQEGQLIRKTTKEDDKMKNGLIKFESKMKKKLRKDQGNVIRKKQN